ncbi:MAG: RagB/SusD family nutrient uptake outer membrane protein [Bacteroidota bacterium]
MKKYIILALIFGGLLSSCSGYLEFPPEGEIKGSDFWNDEADAQAGVDAMYGYLRTWDISAFNYLIVSSLASDEIIKGSVVGDGSWAVAYDNYEYTSTYEHIRDFWVARYKAINLSNQVIDNVPGITMNESVKARMIAEAKFLRALHYFYLVRAFGGVPVILSLEEARTGAARSTVEETYAAIEADLLDAVDVLPSTLPQEEFGRATSWAAKALLAKVYMYEEKWTDCKAMTEDIIQNGQNYADQGPFDLYEDYYLLFRPEQEFCKESIFEILSSEVDGNGDISKSQFAETQLPRGIANWGGWGWFAPSDACAAAFDAAGDTLRKRVTILTYGDRTQDGDSILGVTEMEGNSIPRYNGKVYVPSRFTHTTGPAGCEQNVRLIRFAEILLIDAEAATHTGGDVATPLNRIRARAKLDPIGSPTIEDVWRERQLELAGEQDRFWDLVRTGRAASVLGPLGFEAGKHELFPIPEKEIELLPDLLEQNPGW